MNICCIRADILAKYDIYFCYNPGKTQFLIIIHKIKLTLVFQLDYQSLLAHSISANSTTRA